MTVLPGSLDYLYYNGVLDHIPYEAYEMIPASRSNQQTGLAGFPPLGSLKKSILVDGYNASVNTQNTNKSDYLNSAMKGEMYGYYGNSNDSFTRSANSDFSQNGNFSQMQAMSGAGYGSYGGMTAAGMNANGSVGSMNSAQGLNNGSVSSLNDEDYPKYSLFNGDYNNVQGKRNRKKDKNGVGKAILTMLAVAGAIAGGVLIFKKKQPT